MPSESRRAAQIVAHWTFDDSDSDPAAPIIVEGLALPWDQTVTLNSYGDTVEFTRGSVVPPDPSRVKLLLDHQPKPFGYGVDFDDRPDGLHARMAIPRDELDDPEVARAVRQMRNGVRDAFSVGVDWPADGAEKTPGNAKHTDHYRVTAGQLHELSSVVIPRFDDARISRIAATGDVDDDTDPADGDDDAQADDTEPQEDDMPDTLPAAGDVEAARVAAHITATQTAQPRPVTVPHPFATFATFGEYYVARHRNPDGVPSLAAAWADQITVDNPGVIPPAWLTDIKGIVDRGRPVINAVGRVGLPDSGMAIDWPFYDGDLATLVGEQTAEKTAVTSAKVSIKKTSADLRTFAGGSDISLQLLERSSPSYQAAYMRIMAAAYALTTETAAATALVAAAAAETVITATDLANVDKVVAALFDASVKVELATGQPASVVLAATDVFLKVGPAIGKLQAPAANTAQASVSARTLAVDLSGLSVVHAPALANGQMIVTNQMACAWHEDGPNTISALDVQRLGMDVAVWGMGAFTAYVPNGIVKAVATATP